MFYSAEILNIKSNSHLGIVWLASTLGPKSNAKRLNRKDLTSISVHETCAFLTAPPSPLSLRLSANLMIGLSRVYGQQWQFHMSDVQGLCTKLSHINTPANPEAIDLLNHEKKGTNITLKKIDCISAVNVLPGDALNFPDLDISNLLMSESHRASILSTSTVLNTETGRKSFSLGTPFSTPSSNALHGSDFASVVGDSDFGPMNDHDTIDQEIFPLRQINNPPFSSQSENFEFQVPNEIKRQQRAKQRNKKFKNSLMDQELMLEKDRLFIDESELLGTNLNDDTILRCDPFKVALSLLNNPDELFFESESIFMTTKLNFSYEKNKIEHTPNIKNKFYHENLTENYMDNDDYGLHENIEFYRNDQNGSSLSLTYTGSTPSNLILPWSSSSADTARNPFSSAILNTPIRKGGQSTPSPLTDLTATSSFSSSPFKQFSTSLSLSLSQDTFDFFYFLQDTIESSVKIKLFTFSIILPKEKTNRPVAARAFYHLLELKTANLIDVKQNRPFSQIEISINY